MSPNCDAVVWGLNATEGDDAVLMSATRPDGVGWRVRLGWRVRRLDFCRTDVGDAHSSSGGSDVGSALVAGDGAKILAMLAGQSRHP